MLIVGLTYPSLLNRDPTLCAGSRSLVLDTTKKGYGKGDYFLVHIRTAWPSDHISIFICSLQVGMLSILGYAISCTRYFIGGGS